MLPATFSDVELSSPVQCAAVLSLGLLYAQSGHRMMTELLVAEMLARKQMSHSHMSHMSLLWSPNLLQVHKHARFQSLLGLLRGLGASRRNGT